MRVLPMVLVLVSLGSPAFAARAPSCKRTVDALVKVLQATLNEEARDASELAMNREIVEQQRPGLLERCTDEKWSDVLRTCYERASDETATMTCEREDFIAKGMDLGGPDCAVVSAHSLDLALDTIEPDPAHRQRLEVRSHAACLTMTRQQKECALRAESRDALIACGAP